MENQKCKGILGYLFGHSFTVICHEKPAHIRAGLNTAINAATNTLMYTSDENVAITKKLIDTKERIPQAIYCKRCGCSMPIRKISSPTSKT